MNPAVIKQQIANLRISHPELAADEEAWLLSLESETNLDELLRAVERKRQEAGCMMTALYANSQEIKARHDRFERREQACRDLMFRLMQSADVKKRELPEATLSIANGRRKVLITDEAALPNTVFRIRREPDKNLIKTILEDNSGPPLPGAVLSNAEAYLAIRTK